MEKKKILVFGIKYFPSRGGTSRVVENLISQMKDEYEFTIYCYKHPEAATHMEGVETIQFPEIKIKGVGVFVYYFICCMHLLFKSKKYDLVHMHKTDAAFFLPLITRRYKTIATSHALPYLNDKWSGPAKAYFRMVERIFMRSGAVVTSIARPQSQYYSEKYNRKVVFIPNGVEPASEFNDDLVNQILEKYNIKDAYVLFAARRIIPLKGAHHLLKALQKIGYKGPIVMAGDTEQLPQYTKELKEIGKGLDLNFIGFISDKATLMSLVRKAKLFAFPSELEGMSMMLLEVGSLNTPILASDIPQNQAVFTEKDVLFFKTQNVDDLAEKFQWAMENQEELKKKASLAYSKVINDFSSDQVARQYANLYNQVMGVRALQLDVQSA